MEIARVLSFARLDRIHGFLGIKFARASECGRARPTSDLEAAAPTSDAHRIDHVCRPEADRRCRRMNVYCNRGTYRKGISKQYPQENFIRSRQNQFEASKSTLKKNLKVSFNE
jgi:hypothetical protein